MRCVTAKLLAIALVCSASAFAQPASKDYTIERIVAPSAFYGVHGLAFDARDQLFAGSVVGRSIYAIDRDTGKVDVVVGAPEGMADDLVVLADGTFVWTSIIDGLVRARKGTEPIREIAKLASVNSINVRKRDGRLFAGQVFGGDAIWELDPTGAKAPRLIVDKPGGFNGFDVGPDGMLYGPLWFKHQVVRVHPDTSELKVIATDFVTPAAANFDSKGRLFVLDTATIFKLDLTHGTRRILALGLRMPQGLGIGQDGTIFVVERDRKQLTRIDARTGATSAIVTNLPVGRAGVADAVAGVAIGSRGTLYVLSDVENSIYRLTPRRL